MIKNERRLPLSSVSTVGWSWSSSPFLFLSADPPRYHLRSSCWWGSRGRRCRRRWGGWVSGIAALRGEQHLLLLRSGACDPHIRIHISAPANRLRLGLVRVSTGLTTTSIIISIGEVMAKEEDAGRSAPRSSSSSTWRSETEHSLFPYHSMSYLKVWSEYIY